MPARRSRPWLASAIFITIVALLSFEGHATYPVAGVRPDARPAGAPTITTVTKDAAWYARALTGIDPPYPRSLRFLEDQGAWYTPFTRPGMLPPYDLRHWHTPGASTTRKP